MSIRLTAYILSLMLALAVTLPALHADEANQALRVTFSQPVQVPGRTLPTGTYWFERADSNFYELISVYDSDHEIIGTFFTIARKRRDATSHTAFIFADQVAGKAQAVVAWFYPGERTDMNSCTPSPCVRNLRATNRKLWLPGTKTEVGSPRATAAGGRAQPSPASVFSDAAGRVYRSAINGSDRGSEGG